METFFLFLFIMAVCGFIGYAISGAMGAVLGTIFGPFGLLIAAVAKDKDSE